MSESERWNLLHFKILPLRYISVHDFEVASVVIGTVLKPYIGTPLLVQYILEYFVIISFVLEVKMLHLKFNDKVEV